MKMRWLRHLWLKPALRSGVPTGLRAVCRAYPALKRWANLCRTYGARTSAAPRAA